MSKQVEINIGSVEINGVGGGRKGNAHPKTQAVKGQMSCKKVSVRRVKTLRKKKHRRRIRNIFLES